MLVTNVCELAARYSEVGWRSPHHSLLRLATQRHPYNIYTLKNIVESIVLSSLSAVCAKKHGRNWSALTFRVMAVEYFEYSYLWLTRRW